MRYFNKAKTSNNVEKYLNKTRLSYKNVLLKLVAKNLAHDFNYKSWGKLSDRAVN